MPTCPSDETLARLGDDSLEDAQWAAVEAHIQDCEKCLGSLEKLASYEPATTPDSLPAGEHLPQIAGFVIEGEIGRGGMGVVYRATEPKLARTVALKIVPSGPLTGPRERKRWLSEAQCVTRVSHPNIVKIYNADESGGWLYLVLEFVPGGSLKERLRGPVPPRDAAEFMKPVAAAMTAVHAAGLLHLDLKPSNILLDSAPDTPWKDACPKVADFGIARPQVGSGSNATSLAGPWGTPSYMAPEQIAANRTLIGPATDVYALGAILYELLTGRPPFLAASPIETFDQVRNAEPASPRSLNPGVPRDLDTICLRCLQKDPRKRYPLSEALADDLNRFLEGRPINARPVSPIGHAWRWCRRQPVIAALVATLFLMVVGSFLGLTALLRRSETLRARSVANYRVASRALDEMLKVMSDTNINDDIRYERFKYKDSLELALSQEIEFARQYPLDAGALKQVATITRYLAQVCVRNSKLDEARSRMEQSLSYSEAYLEASPGDFEMERQEFYVANWLMGSYNGSGRDDLYERWNARATAMLNPRKSTRGDIVRDVFGFSTNHRAHADDLLLHGDLDRARKALEEDLAIVKFMRIPKTVVPLLDLSEALTLAALGRWSGECTPHQYPVHPQPAVDSMNLLEFGLAEMAARRIGWLPSIGPAHGIIRIPRDDTEAWADHVISMLKTDAAKFGIDHTRITKIAWTMREQFGATMASQRKVRKLADAHQVATQVIALAQRLTRLYPAQAYPHMLLSEACVQSAKNATREYNVLRKKHWEQEAINAADHAAAIEPENDEAHALAKDRRRRLK